MKPFLEDTTVRERLIQEAYERMCHNVDIDHFMYTLGNGYVEQQKKFQERKMV